MSFEDTTPTARQSGSQPPQQPQHDQGAPTEQIWGAAPAADRPRWSAKKTAIAVGVAVVIAAGGGVAIAAASGSSSSTSSTGPGGMGGFGGEGASGASGYGQLGTAGGGGAGLAVLSGALHGDFVVKSSSGTYTTERMQTGKATKVSSTSITVASDDGYTSTYVINSSTALEENGSKVTSVTTGETVTVLATLDNSVATATTVEEGTTTSGASGGMGNGEGTGTAGGPGGSGSGSGGPGGTGGAPSGMGGLPGA